MLGARHQFCPTEALLTRVRTVVVFSSLLDGLITWDSISVEFPGSRWTKNTDFPWFWETYFDFSIFVYSAWNWDSKYTARSNLLFPSVLRWLSILWRSYLSLTFSMLSCIRLPAAGVMHPVEIPDDDAVVMWRYLDSFHRWDVTVTIPTVASVRGSRVYDSVA